MSRHPDRSDRGGLVPLFALLYFSEGAPIGFIWWALPTLLRGEGVEVGAITSLSAALVLPWTLKFLWAPLVDALRGPRWHRRHWITVAQLGMGACLVPLLWVQPQAHFPWWSGLLFAHAFFAATQDVAIDALAVQSVPPERRGWVNGAMQAGMLVGRSLFGGFAIVVAHRWGLTVVFAMLLAAIWITLAYLWWRPLADGDLETAGMREVVRRVGRSTLGLLARRTTWCAVVFALTGGAAFEAAGALRGPYLVDHQVAEETIGWFFAVPSTAAMLVGGLVGGVCSDRVGRVRAVGASLVLIVLAVGALAAMPESMGSAGRLAWFGILYLGIGLFTASSYALFMDLADPVAGATQFTAFMAATNVCEAWSGWAGGQLVERSGYPLAFAVMAAVSLLSLGLLVPLARARLVPEGS